MDDRKAELVERLALVADRMVAKSRQAAMQDWAGLDLTMPQLRALGFLGREPRRMSDLAAHLGSSVSATTSLIERLEAKGLVARAHGAVDRRVVRCGLTPTGRTLIERFWRRQRLQLASVADILDVAELTLVIEALELLAAAFEQRGVEPGLGRDGERLPLVARS